MSKYGLHLKPYTFTRYLDGDTIKARICRKCYDYKEWDKFSRYLDNEYYSICMDCERKNSPKISLKPKPELNVRYILYLHPHKDSYIYQFLETYWTKSLHYVRSMNIPNDCMRYPFHITLPGFYGIKDDLWGTMGKGNEEILTKDREKNIREKVEKSICESIHLLGGLNLKFHNHSRLNVNGLTYFRGLFTKSDNVYDFLGFLVEKMYGETYNGKIYNGMSPKNHELHLSLYNYIDREYVGIFEKLLEGIPRPLTIDKFTITFWKNTTDNTSINEWEIINEWDL